MRAPDPVRPAFQSLARLSTLAIESALDHFLFDRYDSWQGSTPFTLPPLWSTRIAAKINSPDTDDVTHLQSPLNIPPIPEACLALGTDSFLPMANGAVPCQALEPVLAFLSSVTS